MAYSRIALAIVGFFAATSQASVITIGPNGINSAGLTDFHGNPLTGAFAVIGQVEQGRPGDAAVGDDLAHRNTTTDPAGVFIKDNPAAPPPNTADVRNHAQEVAGVMISTNTTDPDGGGPNSAPTGVAPGASLYSSAFVVTGAVGYRDAILTMQFIATRSNMRAVNHSWGKPSGEIRGQND